MEFQTQATFVTEFSRRKKIGFITYPVINVNPDEDPIWIKATPPYIEAYGVFCLVQDNNLIVEEWIANMGNMESAENLRRLMCIMCGLDNCQLLTLQMLKDMEAGTIIGTGVVFNARIHNGMIRWIAKRGDGFHDWAIYYHNQNHTPEYILSNGDKLTSEANIRQLIPCDQEAFGLYRK